MIRFSVKYRVRLVRTVSTILSELLCWSAAMLIWNRHFVRKFGVPRVNLWDVVLLVNAIRLILPTGNRIKILTDEEISEMLDDSSGF
jgi:hypothetical protein